MVFALSYENDAETTLSGIRVPCLGRIDLEYSYI